MEKKFHTEVRIKLESALEYWNKGSVNTAAELIKRLAVQLDRKGYGEKLENLQHEP